MAGLEARAGEYIEIGAARERLRFAEAVACEDPEFRARVHAILGPPPMARPPGSLH
jgi:hypothetical protein